MASVENAELPVRRVLVLGAGFLGAPIVASLVAKGLQVDVVTRSAPEAGVSDLLTGASVVIGDANSMSTLAGAVAEADHVVYAVGSSSPSESHLDPARDLEVALPPVVRLLELLRLRPSVGLTYLSSGGAVYGNTTSQLASENEEPSPISSYGILKLTAEKYIGMYASLYDVPARIVRVANAYGPGQPWAKGQGIVARLMQSALTGDPFPAFGDGSNVRDYIYIDDVAYSIAELITRSDPSPIVNLGSGIGHSISELIGLARVVTARNIAVEWADRRNFDVHRIVLDIDLLRSAIPFSPTSLRAGLTRTWHELLQTEEADLPDLTFPRTPGIAR